MRFKVKRVYDAPESSDGLLFLVERFWPRGLKKESLNLDGWLKNVAPSDGLRRWFAHDPAKWDEFKRRYFAELNEHPQVFQPLLDEAGKGSVTLLFSTRYTVHNNAQALKEYLEELRRRLSD